MQKLFILSCIISLAAISKAQINPGPSLQASEFTIPASPAFDLLAVNPAQITRPNTIKDFKVDWSFRSWRLKPNLAVQAQPIWEAFYNRPSLSKYREASPFLKTLSTLDISAGTIEDELLQRRASAAVKINLYREYDPLQEARLFEGIDTTFNRISEERAIQIMAYRALMKQPGLTVEDKAIFNNKIDSLQIAQSIDSRAHKEKTQAIASEYVKSLWNASHIDLAWGRVFAFDNVSFDSLTLDGKASAIWLTASKGIGRKILLTGMIKYLIQEQIDSLLRDNNIVSGGVGIRYGSTKFNFFSEFIFSSSDTPNTFSERELNLTQLQRFSMSYGGDWRINANVLLSYGVRLDYAEGFKLKNILPVAGVSCMMR